MPVQSEQPQQLTFRYSTPTRPLRLSLALSGTLILCETPDKRPEDMRAYLLACGIVVQDDEMHGIYFDARDIPKLRYLHDLVTLESDASVRTLLRLGVERTDDGVPLTLTTDDAGKLEVTWYEGEAERSVSLDEEVARAFLQSSLAFTATEEAWRVLRDTSSLPVALGVAHINLAGAVEILSSKPQLVEQLGVSELRGLYKIDDARFGMALAYVDDVKNVPGLSWEGPEPDIEHGPSELDVVPIELSRHTKHDLGSLVEQLAAYKAQTVVWDSGLGRRVFALSALAVLDAWPLLIVAPPSSMWAWQRHLDLLGKKWSLRHGKDDVHLVTYRDLAKRHIPLDPASIIFDGLASDPSVRDPAVMKALHRLDGVMHAYRIAIDSTWPEDLDESTHLLSLLKPGEFSPDVAILQRYPVFSEQRARDHVRVYLSTRSKSDTSTNEDALHPFRRSSVLALSANEAQVRALEELRQRGEDPSYVLNESLEIISNGTAQSLSPKITVGAQQVRRALVGNKHVAVVTRHERTAVLLRGLLRGLDVSIVASPSVYEGASAVQIVVAEGPIPPLGAFDEVFFLDYPWSFTAIERCVGSAAQLDGPGQVTCLHLVGTLDDRLAMLAARRREFDKLATSVPPPDFVEIEYLLAVS